MGGCLGFLSGATAERRAETFDSVPRGAAPPGRGAGGRGFEQYRAQARVEADKRRDLAARSQAAWKAGNKGGAHDLSVQSKAHGAKADELNALAVKAILEPQRSASTGVLDLHGLFVHEAEDATREFLRSAHAPPTGEVKIITGRGIHSAHHVAKVKPAIIALLRKSGYSYRPVPRNEGAFFVTVEGGETPV